MHSFYITLKNHLTAEYHSLGLWYFVSFIAGIIVYFTQESPLSLNTSIAIFIGSLSLLTVRRRSSPLVFLPTFEVSLVYQFIACLLIAFALGFVTASWRSNHINVTTISKPIISELTGLVEQVKPTTKGLQVTLKEVRLKKHLKNAPTKVRISIRERFGNDFLINDKIQLLTKLHPLSSSILPGTYDFGFYAYFSGIGATGYAMSPVVTIKNDSSSVGGVVYEIRKSIYDSLIAHLGSIKGNFAAAILLGETKGIDRELMQDMRRAGISHILCVSGLHLSLVAMIFFVSIRFSLNLSDYIAHKFNIKAISAIASLVGSYFYLELSGMQIAATRAFIMTAIFIVSIIIERSSYPLRSITLAAGLILCVNPEYVFHPSFQLSFIAVLSLISGYEFYLRNQWMLGSAVGLGAQIKFYLASNIYSSFLASIVTAPVVINQFYIFSSYSIPMNLIAVPIMSFFLMPLAIISVILMPFGLHAIPFKWLGFFIDIITKSAHFANQLPGSVWYFGYITQTSLLLFLFGFFWICLWQTRWRLWGLPIMSLSFILMLFSPKPDLILDSKLNALGIKNAEGKLSIYAQKLSSFNRIYWANWFGQEDATLIPEDISAQNHLYTARSGQKIAINYQAGVCTDANVQINIGNICPGRLGVSKEQLQKTGVVLVFCRKRGCYVR